MKKSEFGKMRFELHLSFEITSPQQSLQPAEKVGSIKFFPFIYIHFHEWLGRPNARRGVWFCESSSHLCYKIISISTWDVQILRSLELSESCYLHGRMTCLIKSKGLLKSDALKL